MSQAKWIWYQGDFELYHSMKLHTRREERDTFFPPFWALSAPYPNAVFFKHYSSDAPDTLRVVCPDDAGVVIDGIRRPVGKDFPLPAGNHRVEITVGVTEGFPRIYINSKYLVTDESWTANHVAGAPIAVGCSPDYTSPTDDPTVFKFSYDRVDPVCVTEDENGKMYDFGRELFGILRIEGADPTESLRVTYGESVEEASEFDQTIIRSELTGKSSYSLPSRAYRYVHIESGSARRGSLEVWTEYEYLPLTDRAYFSCDRQEVEHIWNICAYTLHLNSREFFLDGIKRDRWVWSGDAYQSYLVSRYLYFDTEIIKRTIIALLGKPPYEQHINTINDYSMYLIIGAYEYYLATGDAEFIRLYFPRFSALYDFIVSRLDESGYVCHRHGDWIFIDWADMDKSGPLAAEQILLWQCHNAMAELSELIGQPSEAFRKAAGTLKRRIMRDFWREERGAFIDCHTSGLENVTRHANIFAVMYDFVSERRAKRIAKCVLENDGVRAITTPYFEFFELCALCKLGKLEVAQRMIESYWGGMIALGATSIWEEYDPKQSGIEHYAMYGNKYGRSLCHAWGGGPIYLLGRYCLGVYPTSVGYGTFAVEPKLGIYKNIKGKVPLPEGGEVEIEADAHSCTVKATRAGGTLIFGGKKYGIPEGESLTVTK